MPCLVLWQSTKLLYVFVQSLSRVQLFAIPMNCSTSGFLSFTISQSLLRFMSTELVMPSNHLSLSHPPPFSSFPLLSQHQGIFQ